MVEEVGPETIEDLLSHEGVQTPVQVVGDELDGYNRGERQCRKVYRRLIASRNMRVYDLPDDPGEGGDRDRVYDDRRDGNTQPSLLAPQISGEPDRDPVIVEPHLSPVVKHHCLVAHAGSSPGTGSESGNSTSPSWGSSWMSCMRR